MFTCTRKSTFSKILVWLMALAMVITMIPSIDLFAASDVNVNLSSQKQVIRGFGGMNHPVWISDLTSGQRETAFGNGTNQLGLSILRIHVDENKNNWSKEVATAKAAAQKGAIIFASPWNPPSSMVETFTRNGKPNQKRLKYSQYGAYAQHLNDFVTYMKNNGVNLYAISVQNEPDYADEWTWWTPQEILNFMKNYADSINCRVIAPESFQYLKNMSDPILNDAKALSNMDILGAHFYGTQVSQMPYPLFQQKGAGKELWMTEVYVPNSDANSADRWPEAVQVSTNIHNALVEGNFQAYVWWYIRRSYSLMNENGAVTKRGYAMAQYSKFIRPGYVRVDATKNPDTNVLVSAYKGDDKAVIVAINKGSSAVTQKFNVSGGNIATVDRYRTSANENLAKTANLETSGNGFWAQLPANSVSTFVCSLGTESQTGTVTPIQTPTPVQSATVKDGWYYIKNTNAQKYLQVKDNKGANGQNVEISTGTGVAGQKWYLTNVDNGYVTLKNGTGFMLDVTYGKDENGTNMQVYSANGATAQQYKLVSTAQNGVYGILTRCSSDTKGLDVEQRAINDGANVLEYAYSGASNQTWVLESCDDKNIQEGTTTETKPVSDNAVAVKVVSDWGSGATAEITITNTTNSTLNNWTCTFTTDRPITAIWNGTIANQSGNTYTVTPPSWQASLAPGESCTLGGQLGSGPASVTISNVSIK